MMSKADIWGIVLMIILILMLAYFYVVERTAHKEMMEVLNQIRDKD